jgi:UDPglucose--hexose-1-phosphate uridylyltransferase
VAEPTFDPLGRRWVLLAPERAARPAEGGRRDDLDDPAPCDFCAGRERDTPPTTLKIPDDGAWRVRVFPNKFPAARVHEVVVHSPSHDVRFETLDHRADVVRAWRERLSTYTTPAVVAIVNRGREAGATRVHEHSQLFGLEVVPPVLERERAAFADECPACDLMTPDDRVAEIGGVVLVAHPVPLVPHELLILPPHAARFEDAPDTALVSFSDAIADALRRVRVIMEREAGVNVIVHTAPRGSERFHWHAHVYPRSGSWGALEIGAEIPIVAADPADSARRYRST